MDALTELHHKRTAHTLFLDFVGYSRLSEAGQMAVQRELHALVQHTGPVVHARAAGQLALRRTGDGMALLFYGAPEDPVRCALELDAQIRQQHPRLREAVGAPFRIRMGIHSGTVVAFGQDDAADVAGEGINTAQRVMDCGDDGHILLSSATAQPLRARPEWGRWLHDLGNCRVKHEELVHLYSLHGTRDDGLPIGNEAVPRQVFASQENARKLAERDLALLAQERRDVVAGTAVRGSLIGVGALAVVAAGFFLYTRTGGAATDMTRFTKKVAQAAEKRRAQKTRANAVTDGPDPVGTPRPSTRGVDADVPSLTGLSEADARGRLAPLGLTLLRDGRAPRRSHPTIPADAVVAQDPPAGRALVANGEVFVTLSSGPDGSLPDAAPTGVVVDARSLPPRPEGATGALSGPDGALGSVAAQTRTDDEDARGAGDNPLRLAGEGWDDTGGVRLSAADATTYRNLPDAARRRSVLRLP